MKKITILSVAVLGLTLASCKKDYKCTCTTTSGSFTSDPDVTTFVGVSKGTAKANCVSYTETYTGGTSTTNCTLSK